MSSNNYFKVKEAFFFFHDADRTSCASAWDHAKLAAGEEHPVDRKSTRLNSSHIQKSRMPSSA